MRSVFVNVIAIAVRVDKELARGSRHGIFQIVGEAVESGKRKQEESP